MTLEGKNVLLVNLDPQASLSISLGKIQPDTLDKNKASIMNEVITDISIDNK